MKHSFFVNLIFSIFLMNGLCFGDDLKKIEKFYWLNTSAGGANIDDGGLCAVLVLNYETNRKLIMARLMGSTDVTFIASPTSNLTELGILFGKVKRDHGLTASVAIGLELAHGSKKGELMEKGTSQLLVKKSPLIQ